MIDPIPKPEKFIPQTIEGKLVKTRKKHKCYRSGEFIPINSWVESSKVFPSTGSGQAQCLSKPKTFYFCNVCGECTH